jgi:hypothetical protein
MKKIVAGLIGGAVIATGLALAPAAHADLSGDYMYRVGGDIQSGDYTYRVVGANWGSWETCSNATCDIDNGLINMDVIDGAGHTGYLTIPPSTKFVKIINLQLAPS